jgi:uncharacterized protein (DUF1778 family)
MSGNKRPVRTAARNPISPVAGPSPRWSHPSDETPSVKGQRLTLRVEDRELFDRAAEANRETLMQFLVAGSRERAERLLADRTRFQLSPDAWEELVAIMDRGARPNPKLARLFSRPSAA